MKPSTQKATNSELAAYEQQFAWRARWGKLANKREPGRSCQRQERIERRALLCNLNIAKLMHAFDLRINNTRNPIGQDAVVRAQLAYFFMGRA